jgi:hypothetical protein
MQVSSTLHAAQSAGMQLGELHTPLGLHAPFNFFNENGFWLLTSSIVNQNPANLSYEARQ